MIRVTDDIVLADDEIDEHFIRASGPGGQNVNKVASAVQLRFDAMASPALTDGVRQRLKRLAGSRMNQDGVIVLTAGRFRSQERNREDAHNRLIALIQAAAKTPRRRRPTRPTKASRERRLDSKKRQAATKALRRGV